MSARDELANLLCRNELYYDTGSHFELCVDDAADAILAAGYSKPRTITTAEELDALPQDAVVRDAGKTIFEKGLWWNIPGSEADYESGEIPLPATVLFTPKES